MNPILLAVLLVSAIGLIAGLGLSIASAVLAVPVDEKTVKIRECLPGANCGACGFSGCDGYAEALSSGQTTNTALCSPGGKDAAEAIAEVTGLAVSESVPMTAVVHCKGNRTNAVGKLDYVGIESCRMAIQVFGGPKACSYGCLGFGDCMRECPVCPKHLISVVPKSEGIPAVLCMNHEKGAATRKQCKAGCIGCMKCVKNCEVGAISVINFCAQVDPEKCVACGKCAEGCPVKCIHILGGKAVIAE